MTIGTSLVSYSHVCIKQSAIHYSLLCQLIVCFFAPEYKCRLHSRRSFFQQNSIGWEPAFARLTTSARQAASWFRHHLFPFLVAFWAIPLEFISHLGLDIITFLVLLSFHFTHKMRLYLEMFIVKIKFHFQKVGTESINSTDMYVITCT